jgi:hypothetical protein
MDSKATVSTSSCTRGSSRLLFALAVAFAVTTAVSATDQYSDVQFVPPKGFNGHEWGELQFGFERLSDRDPIGVGAAWIRPQEREVTYTCQVPEWIGPRMNSPAPTCQFAATPATLSRVFEGGGFYVLSEYTIEGQGFRIGDERDGVELFPAVYQFCANWDKSRKRVPRNFSAMNKFCGVRLMFLSETREQLAKLPAAHETVYDRLLERLLAKYGHPDRFVRRGQVTVETEEGNSDVEARKYTTWRWCPPRERAFHTDCEASVTLTIEPASGRGMVLYSTPLLWQYAYAREKNGFKGDWLYAVLHANRKNDPKPSETTR